MTITESLISSFILVALTTQSGQLFGNSIQALSKSRLRDSINAAINRDIEDVRQSVASWEADTTMTTNGQLTYWPDKTHCDEGTLATALLSDQADQLPTTSKVNLSGLSIPLQGVEVMRTIGIHNGNANLIQVNYSTSETSLLKAESSTTLSIPAQGWCPT